MSSPYHAGRIGDGVREKSGRGGVVRSRPNGRSEDGEAHAWLGPAALLGPASPDLTGVVMSMSLPSPPLPRNFSKY